MDSGEPSARSSEGIDMADPVTITAMATIGGGLVGGLTAPCFQWLISNFESPESIARRKIKAFEADEIVRRYQENQARGTLVEQMRAIGPLNLAFQDRAALSMISEAMYSQHNREAIAALAFDMLQKDGLPLPEDNPLDEDFMIRFYRHSSDVGKEQAQQVWAKLLVGEIRNPGAFSPRTLDILRNLTQEEALLAQEVATFLFQDLIPTQVGYCFPDLFQQVSFHAKLLMLEASGLSVGTGSSSRLELQPGQFWRIEGTGSKITLRNTTQSVISFLAVAPTRAFMELHALFPPTLNNRFISHIVAEFRNMGCRAVFDDISQDDGRKFDTLKESALFKTLPTGKNTSTPPGG